MERKIDQKYIVDELNVRTGYYKKDLRRIMDELENIIIENMRKATLKEPSEARLFYGFVLGAKCLPERERRDPRNQKKIKVAESLNPYARFKQSFLEKVNNKKVKGEI